jgi:hypothetical protein
VVLVGQEPEVQRLLVGELLDRADRVRGDADDDRAGGLVVGAVVTDPAGLRRATGRVGLGIEIQDDRLAAEVGERDVLRPPGRVA